MKAPDSSRSRETLERIRAKWIHFAQTRQVKVDHGTYRPGDKVDLRIVAADGTIERRFEATLAGYDRDTGNPVFDPPAGESGGRRIVLAREAVESFIDHVDRAVFSNYPEFVAMYGPWVPDMAEMGLPRAMSARQVPKRISSRLATRAGMT